MFSHVMIGANDLEKSKVFYDAILNILGYESAVRDEKGRCIYISPEGILALGKPINGEIATHGNGMTVGFKAMTPELVDAWHAAANGGETCEEPPGVRGSKARKLYLGYLRDPSGNKICATHFMP